MNNWSINSYDMSKRLFRTRESEGISFLKNHFLGTIVESEEHNMIPLYSTVFQ